MTRPILDSNRVLDPLAHHHQAMLCFGAPTALCQASWDLYSWSQYAERSPSP
ncbi:MAG: hypothetical protein F6K19_36920 [Cyanothece sp. SIO1E1]|nr:hypothetical protein [Cyanothece sp. SIO1E1]